MLQFTQAFNKLVSLKMMRFIDFQRHKFNEQLNI